MGYRLSTKQFDQLLESLRSRYRVFGPAVDKDGGCLSDTDRVTYKEVQTLADLELQRKSYFSPKEVIYPIRETLFYFTDGEIGIPEVEDKGIVILLRPCDINGIDRLDTIFCKNGPHQDFYYKRRRDKVRFFMIECTEGFENCWCVAMNANRCETYDVALRFGDEILADVRNNEFDDDFTTFREKDFTVGFIEKNSRQVRVPQVGKVTPDLFEHDMWKEYSARCIACGRCNTSCITCSCFTLQDTAFGTGKKMGERRRRWAGCQIDGFTDMAGGHRFRVKHGDKMRFKTLHKVSDFHRRFGSHQCVGCGRCDDVCPQYISFARCVDTLSEIIAGEETL